MDHLSGFILFLCVLIAVAGWTLRKFGEKLTQSPTAKEKTKEIGFNILSKWLFKR